MMGSKELVFHLLLFKDRHILPAPLCVDHYLKDGILEDAHICVLIKTCHYGKWIPMPYCKKSPREIKMKGICFKFQLSLSL